jgi:hypothetical protein
MENLSREQIDQLAQDISFVKKAIEKNASILNRIDFRSSLRLTILLSAISIFLFCGAFQILIRHFGCFTAIPTTYKVIGICAIALDFVLLGIIKNTGVLKSARNVEPGMTWLRLIKEYYSARMYHHFIPTGLVLLFACIYAAYHGQSRMIIPILSIGAGLLYNTFHSWLRIDEFLVMAYWFIISGCIIIVFNPVPFFLSLASTLGCGLLLLTIIWYLPRWKHIEA